MSTDHIINETAIADALQAHSSNPHSEYIEEILAKAQELGGLNIKEVAALSAVTDNAMLEKLFSTAKHLKEQIYNNRIVLFAPIYISNLCDNNCTYCAFCSTNSKLQRCRLNQNEIADEVATLINQGQKRLLLVAGEENNPDFLQYVLESIDTIYSIKSPTGAIRRVNINIAPLSTDEFRRLKDAEIGTYQLFQETYCQDAYKKVHLGGKKADYNWRLSAMGQSD